MARKLQYITHPQAENLSEPVQGPVPRPGWGPVLGPVPVISDPNDWSRSRSFLVLMIGQGPGQSIWSKLDSFRLFFIIAILNSKKYY